MVTLEASFNKCNVFIKQATEQKPEVHRLVFGREKDFLETATLAKNKLNLSKNLLSFVQFRYKALGFLHKLVGNCTNK
jgi:hypothetical protein